MLLDGKQAVVYGGGGAIGGAVARAFAREGATVHLAGRTQGTIDAVAEDIRAAGGRAHTWVVDALDEVSVDRFADSVAADHGSLDISFDVISSNDVQGVPLAQMSLEDFEAPIRTLTRTMFLTSRAAARHMIRQGSGVLLAFGGDGDPMRDYSIGGFQIALQAVESLQRQLAAELGRHGIRVLSLQTGGIAESIPPGVEGRDALVESLTGQTLLGRCATLDDVGNVASFAASDLARSITGTALNISCGAII
jgi:3-oxoacyl-[acyl-carrier protein] reductase